ncbi:hypothetical protein DL239_21425, partial [Sedimentitalea sp. CY04]
MASKLPVLYRAPKTAIEAISTPVDALLVRGPVQTLPAALDSNPTQILFYYKGKSDIANNGELITFQSDYFGRLNIAQKSSGTFTLTAYDSTSNKKIETSVAHVDPNEDIEVFILYNVGGVSNAYDGAIGALQPWANTATVTMETSDVDNVGIMCRGHNGTPANSNTHAAIDRMALWFGVAPDLSDPAVRASISDPAQAETLGGALAIDFHGTAEEINRGHLRQGALRLWETGANEFALPASGTPQLTGAGLQVTPELGQGVVTPSYNLTGSGLLVTPELGQGVVTPTYNLTGAGLQVTPMVGMGSLSLTPTLAGMGLAVTPQIDQGVVTPTYTLTGSDLLVTPELGQGVVTPSSPVVTLTGAGLSVTPELGQGVVTPTYSLTGAGLEVTPMVGMGSLSLSVTLTGMGLAATPQVDQGVVTPTYNLSGSGLVVTPEIEQGEVVPTYM